jgi:hypothetical protein
MKRLKMIVTSVVVLAIVGSAFAFNAKKVAVFCVTSGTADQNCFTIQGSKRTTGTGVARLYYTNWDGNLTTCTSGGTGTCNTSAVFTMD